MTTERRQPVVIGTDKKGELVWTAIPLALHGPREGCNCQTTIGVKDFCEVLVAVAA